MTKDLHSLSNFLSNNNNTKNNNCTNDLHIENKVELKTQNSSDNLNDFKRRDSRTQTIVTKSSGPKITTNNANANFSRRGSAEINSNPSLAHLGKDKYHSHDVGIGGLNKLKSSELNSVKFSPKLDEHIKTINVITKKIAPIKESLIHNKLDYKPSKSIFKISF
jgi:hypothetical protein